MEQYKKEFIDFMVQSQVLKFGSFTLKSGRQSPFFMNAGAYITGTQLKKLGEYYAKSVHDNFGDDIDVFFGPAYKGIPLAVTTAIAYSELYGKEIKYCCDRKEEKDHGADKGAILGYKIKDGDKVVIIEDVTTSGKSIEDQTELDGRGNTRKGKGNGAEDDTDEYADKDGREVGMVELLHAVSHLMRHTVNSILRTDDDDARHRPSALRNTQPQALQVFCKYCHLLVEVPPFLHRI